MRRKPFEALKQQFPRFSRSSPAFAALATAAIVVSACAGGEEKPPLPCPAVIAINDASELTRFRGEGRDLTDVVFTAGIGDMQFACEYRKDDTVVETDLRVVMTIVRGPANADDKAIFTYFVAIAYVDPASGEPERIVAREEFDTGALFEGNASRLVVPDELSPVIPLKTGQSGADYRIYVGIKLTPEELAYNRSR